MNIVDLFSGCGGFSLGAHAAGMGSRLAFDNDPILTSSFAVNFPKTRLVLEDLSTITGSAIKRELGGAVHGIFGGPPCQAFSDIGRHNHRGPLFDPVVDFVNKFRDEPIAVSEKVFLSCGMYESLIYENRSLLPLLQETGMEVRYVEARDGHNWENWRDRLREGLSWLFPGPLLMVYE